MIPVVDFCGLEVSRLIIGANPFGGYSHQNQQRDIEMRQYHTIDRIIETWHRAEAVGINTFITNNETPHVLEAVRAYLGNGGSLQWIAQINPVHKPNMAAAIDEAVEIGCKALYFHGALVDDLYRSKDQALLQTWYDHAHAYGIPVGVAGHAPKVHDLVNSWDIVDFHVVCFFNCGSLHDGEGEKFQLCDIGPATECIRRIEKPCIGYKVMGAGRIDPFMALEYAFDNIKPGDVVNVGMHRGDKDGMVEENAAIVSKILSNA